MLFTRRSAVQLIGGGLAGSAFASLPTPSFAATRTMVLATDETPKLLDPLRSLLTPGYRTMYNIYDTLIEVDYKNVGKLRPGLATAWKRLDDKTIEVTLRDNVKFHDGSPMTAEDVAFSFGDERLRDKNSPGYANGQQHLSTIEKAVVVDPKTVRIFANVPDPVLELRLSAWGSQIISKAAFQKAGWDGFAVKPVGTGPFAVTRVGPDEVRLTAFADYWNGAPTIPAITYRGVPELSARIAGLASGEFDLICDVPPDQFKAVTRSADLQIVGGPIASFRVVKFDTRNPQLKDPRVRQALSLGVDRKAIVDSFWAGLVDIPNGHQIPSYGALYDPSRPPYEYNPAKAKQLLQAAGYKGEPIPYRIRNNAYGAEVATAQVLVAMWADIGVNIDLQMKENFGQLLAFPGTGMRNGADPVLVNDPLFSLWRSYNESEKDAYPNEAFWKLGHAFETTMDPAQRKQLLKGMLDIFDNDPPAFILHNFGTFYGIKKDVKWTPYPHIYMDFRKDNASIGA